MNYQIQTNKTHTKQLYDLINNAYRGTSGEGRWTTENHLIAGKRITLNAIEKLIDDKSTDLITGTINGAIVCCIAVKHTANFIEFGTFAVDPDYQGKGIGKSLLDYAEKIANSTENIFQVSVVSQNLKLVNFYIKRGYKETGVTLPYPVEQLVGEPKQSNLTLTVLRKIL